MVACAVKGLVLGPGGSNATQAPLAHRLVARRAWTDCSHLVGNSMLVNMLIYAGLQPRTLRGLRWLALSYVQQVHTAGLRVRHVSLDDVFLKLYLGAMALSWYASPLKLCRAHCHVAAGHPT